MLISIENRFVFVANTKTASTSIQKVLKPYAEIDYAGQASRKHVPMKEVLELYADLFEKPGCGPETFFKFGVMREPLDWIQSWFRYRKANVQQNPIPKDMTFAEFWNNADWNIRKQNGEKHLQQGRFMSDDGDMLVDYIIPYHELEQKISILFKALKLPVILGRLNTSNVKTVDGSLTEALREEIREFYEDDYALFNRLDVLNEPAEAELRRRAANAQEC